MNVRATRSSLWKVVLLNQYNLALLGAAIAFALALGSATPLYVFATLEALWVFTALVSARVRRWAIGYVMNQDRLARMGLAAAALRELEPVYAERVERLETVGADIRRMVLERGIESSLLPGGENRLEAALLAFSRMAALHQRLSRFGEHASSAQLEEEILGLGQSLAAEQNPAVRPILSQALAVAQGRFEQKEGLQGQLRVLAVKLGTLEMSFDYLRSRIFGGGQHNQHELAAEVAQLIGNITVLSESETDMASPALARAAPGSATTTRITATHTA